MTDQNKSQVCECGNDLEYTINGHCRRCGRLKDQNKSQESEQKKWSPTPWMVGDKYKSESKYIRDANLHYIGETKTEANAARIVECVNFCEGVSSEDLKYFSDAAKRTQDLPPLEFMAETRMRLLAELEHLKAERDELKKSIDYIHDLDGKTMNGMQEEINNLKAERDRLEHKRKAGIVALASLRNIIKAIIDCGNCENVGPYTNHRNELDAVLSPPIDEIITKELAEIIDLRAQLSQAQASVEWVKEYGDMIQKQYGYGYQNLKTEQAITKLRAILERKGL